jgi:hypothetical protein
MPGIPSFAFDAWLLLHFKRYQHSSYAGTSAIPKSSMR